MANTYVCQMKDGRFKTVEATSWADAKRYYGADAIKIHRAPDDFDCSNAEQNELKFIFDNGRTRLVVPDGEPIDHRDGVPVFRVVPSGRFYYAVASKDGVRQVGCHLLFKCPKCHQLNVHGGLFGKPGGGDGHRCSHCPCWEHGYFIKEG